MFFAVLYGAFLFLIKDHPSWGVEGGPSKWGGNMTWVGLSLLYTWARPLFLYTAETFIPDSKSWNIDRIIIVFVIDVFKVIVEATIAGGWIPMVMNPDIFCFDGF